MPSIEELEAVIEKIRNEPYRKTWHFILPSKQYHDIVRRVASGEDVRLPMSALQFRLDDSGNLYLEWPVKAE